MEHSVTTPLRTALSKTFLSLYGLVVAGLLIASLGVSLWASRFPRFYYGDVEYGPFVEAILPWAVVSVVGLFLALTGLVAIIIEATKSVDAH